MELKGKGHMQFVKLSRIWALHLNTIIVSDQYYYTIITWALLAPKIRRNKEESNEYNLNFQARNRTNFRVPKFTRQLDMHTIYFGRSVPHMMLYQIPK